MEKIVILKGSYIDSLDEYVLTECIKIMFPECEIEIQLYPPADFPNEKAHNRPDKNRSA